MKRGIFILVLAVFAIQLYAQNSPKPGVRLISTEVVGKADDDNLKFHVEFTMEGDQLKITAHNVTVYSREDNPEYLQNAYSVDSDYDNPYLSIKTTAYLWSNSYQEFLSYLVKQDFTYVVTNISDGLKHITLNFASDYEPIGSTEPNTSTWDEENFSNFNYYYLTLGTWMNLEPGFHCDLYPGESALPQKDIPAYSREWVNYNARANGGEGKFYRMRFDGTKEISGREYHALKLYTTDKYVAEEAETIAYMDINDDKAVVLPADVDIESEFWATGLPVASTNPSQWKIFAKNEPQTVYFRMSQKYMNDTFTAYDFLKEQSHYSHVMDMYFTQEAYGVVWSCDVWKFRTSHDLDGNITYRAFWVENVGATGDHYASNLPYPQYELPDGAEPTHFLYVRDIATNEVLWGDPSLDPTYLGVKEIAGDKSGILCQSAPQEVRITAPGLFSVTAWQPDGRNVLSLSATDTLTIPADELPSGVVILRVTAGDAERSFKLMR